MSQLDLNSYLKQAQNLGAQDVELYYQYSESNSIKVYQGQVDSLESATAKGLGVRVFLDEKMGFAYTSDFREEALKEVIKEAVANAEVATADKNRTLPQGSYDYPELDIYNSNFAARTIEEKIDIALKMEEEALEYDDRIKSVVNVNYGDSIYRVKILNSNGLEESYQSNSCYAYLSVIASQNEEDQTGFDVSYGRDLADLTPHKTAHAAAQNAIELLGGKAVESQQAPVVFTPKIGSMFMSVLAQALTAEAVQKGRSLFAGKLGEEVAAEDVTIIDDGTLEEGLATAPFDSEGVVAQRTAVIKEGRLRDYLYDSYTANKDDRESTGNASRGSYRGIPGVSSTNFYLEAGEKEPEEIIAGVENGFYVQKVSGLVTGGANPISGEYSVGASGQWIEDGEIKGAVREVTIAGNLIDFLENIVEIGSDLKFNPALGSFASPTFKVEGIAISGE
ncbi:MAG: TldD/PmbA family protein [Halanaerobacter sp.]